MQGCGRFQAVRVLDTSGAVSVWYARPAGEEAGEKFVIKMIRADMHLTGGEELARDIALLVESARLQKKLADAGAKHWARVHEIATSTEGACFVMDAYALSVGKLIASKVSVGDPGLTALVRGIVEGLSELAAQAGGRAHGALRPNDVLLSAPDPLAADVVLADPAPAGRLGPESARDDLRGIASIIVQVVTGKATRDVPRLPEKPGPEWGPDGKLGRAGGWWFSLCEGLLHPGSGPGAIDTLDALKQKLAEPRAGAGGKGGKKLLIAAAAALVLLAGAGAGAYVLFPDLFGKKQGPVVVTDQIRTDWRALCESMTWLYGLVYEQDARGKQVLGKPFGREWEAIAAAAGDAPLTGVADLLKSDQAKAAFGPKSAAFGARGALADQVPSDLDVASCAAALAEIERIRLAFLAWPPAAQLAKPENFQNLSKAAGQDDASPALAAYLEGCPRVAEVLPRVFAQEPGPGGDVPVLAVAVRDIKAAWDGARRLEESMATFAQVRDLIVSSPQAASDPVLRAFPRLASGAGVRPGQETSGPRAIGEDLDAFASLGREILARLEACASPDSKVRWNHAYLVDTEQPNDDYQTIAASIEKVAPNSQTFRDWILATQSADLKPNDEITGWRIGQEPALELPQKLAADAAALREAMTRTPLRDSSNSKSVEAELTQVEAEVVGAGAPLTRELQALASKRKVQEIQTGKRNLTPRLEAARDHLDNARRLYQERLALEQQNAEQWWKAQEEKVKTLPGPLAGKWREIVDALKKEYSGDHVQASQLVDQWSKSMGEIQQAFGARLDLDQNAGIQPDAFDALLEKRRSQGLEAAARALPGAVAAANLGAEGVFRSWKEQGAEFERWAAQAQTVIEGLGAIGSYLGEGYAPDDPLPESNGRTIIDLEQELPAVDELKAMSAVLDRVRQLEAIQKTTDVDALVNGVSKAKAATVAEGLAAWRRLGSLRAGDRPVWPVTLEQLRVEAELVQRTIPGLLAGASERRRAEFQPEFERQKRARWEVAFAALPTDASQADAQISEAMKLGPDFGVRPGDEASLPAAARYNAERWRLLTEASGLVGEPLAARVRTFLEGVGKIQGLESASGVSGFTTALDTIINGKVVAAVPELDKLGPATQGWTLSEGGSRPEPGKMIAYSKDGVTVRFAPVEVNTGSGTQINYIQTGEVSIGLFDSLAAPEVDTIVSFLGRYGVNSTPPCAIAWIPRRDQRKNLVGFDPAPSWTADTTLSYYPDSVASTVLPPSRESPMQWVTAQAAAYAASLAGCRLPTEAEWRAAVGAYGSAGPNLRDASWVAIVSRINELKVNGADRTTQMAATNLRLPGRGLLFSGDPGDAATDAADGAVWFRNVATGNSVGDLKGNVGEFVLTDGTPFDAPEQVRKELRDGASTRDWKLLNGRVKVVIGTALSAPADANADPKELPDTQLARRDSFADVGFRLAFSAGPGGPKPIEEQYADAVNASGYLLAGRQ